MGEFCSKLFQDLADAADISYNKELPDDAPVFYDERRRPIFTNADALRMDRMKTAIIKLLLLRACNFMRITHQDSISSEEQRCARAEFAFELRTTNILHKDWTEEKLNAVLTGAGAGAGARPASSFSDVVNGQRDQEIETILENFVRAVRYTDRRTGQQFERQRLLFNCPPPPR